LFDSKSCNTTGEPVHGLDVLKPLFATGPQPFGGLKLRFQQPLAGLAAGCDLMLNGDREAVRLVLEGRLGVEVALNHRFGQGVK
jgi:hypothetical protein